MDVYFDDLSVVHYKGALLSEEGYYPFGLGMKALNSQAGAVTPNSYKYNGGTELTEDLDVDYYETYMRQYDAQVGRFTGIDLLSEQAFNFSPYHYGGNDPIYFNDPTGLAMAEPIPVVTVVSYRHTHHYSSFALADLIGGYAGMNVNNVGWGGDGSNSGDDGSPHGGGGGSGQAYHYSYSQWGNLTDLDKRPHNGDKFTKVHFKTLGGGSWGAYYYFNSSYMIGANAGDEEFVKDAVKLEDHFLHGSGSQINLNNSSAIAKQIFNSSEFKKAAGKFETMARKAFKLDGSVDNFNGNVFLNNKMDYLTSNIALTTVIGGIKQFDVDVTINGGNLSFSYTIYDIFGADDQDAGKWYIPGLPGLYYLQHYGNLPGYTLQPFIWSVSISSPY